MKLNQVLSISNLIYEYEKYIRSISETEIEDLSNSDLSFIKLVAPSSISTMKKKGRNNLYILTHSQKEVSVNSKREKVKKLLSSFDRDELLNFLYANGFMEISKSESSEPSESSEESTESSESSEESTESSEESTESSEESTESSEESESSES